MSKKSRKLLIGCIAILSGVASLFFYLNQSRMPLENPEAYAKETNEWMAKTLAAQEAEKKSLGDTVKKASNILQWKILASFQEEELKNVDFYGRVIDQDNNPVAGVLINYDLGGVYLAPGSGSASITTDEKGEFNIDEGKGLTLHFRKMNKPGYQYKSSKIVDGSESLVYSLNNSLWDKTSQENPFIFTLWRLDRYPEVRRGEKDIYSKLDELSHTLDFADFIKKTQALKGLQEGDLQITVDKTKPEENGVVKISAINGGLQETDDLYPFRAPETGYLPSVQYELVYVPRFKDFEQFFKKFYFTSRNGEVYGYIEIDVEPNWDEGYAIFLKYVVNKEKTRDLLVKE